MPFHISRYALAIGVASVLLAGCGGFAQTAMPPIAGTTTQNTALQKTSSEALIYVAGVDGSFVLSYATGKLIAALDVKAVGACSDKNGNVFLLTSDEGVEEYAHGGTTPIATLSLGKRASLGGCSVDPASGDLAVTVSYSGFEDVAVFQGAAGKPTVYSSPVEASFCGYDDAGNLFVDGPGNGKGAVLAELPRGQSSMFPITISQSFSGVPWQVQWDGKYITVQTNTGKGATIYRLQLNGSEGTVVGTTTFSKAAKHPRASWMYGNYILVPFGPPKPGGAKLGLWKYPHGGKPTRVFGAERFGEGVEYLEGVTVSVAPTSK